MQNLDSANVASGANVAKSANAASGADIKSADITNAHLLNAKHIAPLWHCIENLGDIIPRGGAKVLYAKGVHIYDENLERVLEVGKIAWLSEWVEYVARNIRLDSGVDSQASFGMDSSAGRENVDSSAESKNAESNPESALPESALPESISKLSLKDKILALISAISARVAYQRPLGSVDSSNFGDSGKVCAFDIIALLAFMLKSWRKGPFFLQSARGRLYIDSEWQSFAKWDLLAPHANLSGAHIADVGCNNGFYMFAMDSMVDSIKDSALDSASNLALDSASAPTFLDSSAFASHAAPHATGAQAPAQIIGFDPSALFFCQFCFLRHFIDAPISYELLGVQDLPDYTAQAKRRFDVVFCLGVLYHRSDVFSTLKSLAKSLERGGVAFIDTLIFEPQDLLPKALSKPESSALSELDIVLSVPKSYAKMSNVYFIPTIKALFGWLERCGFVDVELLCVMPTTTQEQRKSAWIDSMSLESFLDPLDERKTIEGYPAPKRAYVKAIKK
ncbi:MULTISPECIES: DUF1698 domain-containing protein [unclassified Helicobacter]|uniref:DUF1698 domain-containing protein n=1 Tax=unclassified Helicobacter TaxID=2593540 RepID=UPI000AC3642D|nr:DUF1698 domain-containing protein [Helicobacter sp. CLO-3]